MARTGKPRNPQALASIVYRSVASSLMDDAQLLQILERARRRNQADGVTGLLVYDKGCFFQCIEGPQAKLTPIMNRIRTDPRHVAVEVLVHEEIRARLFPQWSMNLACRNEPSSIVTADPASCELLRADAHVLDGLYRNNAGVQGVLASLRSAS